MLDIIGIGESDVDIYLQVDHLPSRGEKVRALEIGKLPGGMIGNFCSAAAKQGASCGIVSMLGDDANGKIALADYQCRGIDTNGLVVMPGGQTFYCVVYLDGSGEKYLTAVVTDLISPRLEDISADYIRSARYVHMNSMDYALACFVAEKLEGSDTRISLDYEAHAENPGFEDWKPVLKKVSVLFVNEDGIQSLFPKKDMDAAAWSVLGLGAEYVVVTCAEKGGLVYTKDKCYRYKAFAADNIKDTTGAGDCFNATFLSAIIKGMPVEDAMNTAAAAATLSIQAVGARTGQPTGAEVAAFLATHPKTL